MFLMVKKGQKRKTISPKSSVKNAMDEQWVEKKAAAQRSAWLSVI